MEFFDESRVMVAARSLGIAQGAFDWALDYAKKREQLGLTHRLDAKDRSEKDQDRNENEGIPTSSSRRQSNHHI